MAGYGLLVAQQRQGLVGPFAVEKCLLQSHEIFAGHGVVAIDEVGLCQSFVAPATFLEVENGFLSLILAILIYKMARIFYIISITTEIKICRKQ